MVTMENAEEVMQILDRFTRLKQKEIPKELDEYLGYVAKTGDTVFKWSSLKYLFREKLLNVMKHFHDTTPRIDEIPQYPNVDPFNYESMKSALLERLELFNAAPFTIQRLCELLIDPRKQYSRIDKFMRALEKNILVVSTVEPGRKRTESENGDSLDSVVNGDLLLDVNVDIDMEADNLFNMETQAAQNSNGTASKSEVAANTAPSPPQETEKANTSNKEPTVKVVVTHKADDDILPNPKKAKLDITDKSQTEETIDDDDGKRKAAENNGETVNDEKQQQEEKQEKVKESENKTIEEESIKKVDTEECSKNQKEEQAIIEKKGEKLEGNNCEAKVSGIEKNAIKTDSESATKTEVKEKLHNNENIIKSENKENEKVLTTEDDNKMNEQNSEDTKIKKVDKKDEKEKEKKNQEEEEKQLNKTTTTTTAIQGTISEQVTMVVAESKDYETVVVEKQEIEKGEKEKLTKTAAEELDEKMEKETKTVKETSTDEEESKKDNKQQEEEQQNDSIKVVQKEQSTKTETSASAEIIEKNKMETINEEDEDNAASHKTPDTNRKTDHDNDDDDDNAQTHAVAADKQGKCSEVIKNEEKLKEQTKVESIKTTTTTAIATKEPTIVEEATTAKVEDLPQPEKAAAIVVEVEEKGVINEQALPVVIATAVTTEINMATEIESLAQAAADAAAFVKTALGDTLMILPATSLPIQDQPMTEDDVTIAEEAPPTVEEVIMAESSSLQSEPLEATTIIPSPSLTTTNINTTTTTTTTIIDEEPSGMEVDDTSQEAMDQ